MVGTTKGRTRQQGSSCMGSRTSSLELPLTSFCLLGGLSRGASGWQGLARSEFWSCLCCFLTMWPWEAASSLYLCFLFHKRLHPLLRVVLRIKWNKYLAQGQAQRVACGRYSRKDFSLCGDLLIAGKDALHTPEKCRGGDSGKVSYLLFCSHRPLSFLKAPVRGRRHEFCPHLLAFAYSDAFWKATVVCTI